MTIKPDTLRELRNEASETKKCLKLVVVSAVIITVVLTVGTSIYLSCAQIEHAFSAKPRLLASATSYYVKDRVPLIRETIDCERCRFRVELLELMLDMGYPGNSTEYQRYVGIQDRMSIGGDNKLWWEEMEELKTAVLFDQEYFDDIFINPKKYR